jgi:hypothetical protein
MTSRWVVAVAVAAVVTLFGCSAPSPSDGSSPNAGPGETPSASPSIETDFSEISVYYPVALGNTWTYRMDYYGFNDVGIVVMTQTIAEVTPVTDGVQVTIDRSFHHENGLFADSTDSLEFTFHDDGSAILPYLAYPPDSGVLAGQYEVTVTGGDVSWPTVAEFEAATPTASTVTASLSNGAMTFGESVTATLVGQGSEAVTVAAGTFTARKLRHGLVATVIGQGSIPSSVTTWLAEGVGPVRIVVVDEVFGSEIVTVELVEFVPGG